MLRIGPFNYDPLRGKFFFVEIYIYEVNINVKFIYFLYLGVDLWLAQTDEFLLRHLSTSPEVEPPHFAMQVIVIKIFERHLRTSLRRPFFLKLNLGPFNPKVHPR